MGSNYNNSEPAKICVVVLDGASKGSVIAAQFNPQELSFQKAVSWAGGNEGIGMDYPSLMFTSGQAISMSLELLFDEYEKGLDVRPTVKSLIGLCMIDETIKRPPKVQLCWDGDSDVLGIGKDFCGVIENATAKYTMFLANGTPVRASVSISIKQADDLGYKSVIIDKDGKQKTVDTMSFSSVQDVNQTPGARKAAERQGIKVDDPSQYPIQNLVITEEDKQEDPKE